MRSDKMSSYCSWIVSRRVYHAETKHGTRVQMQLIQDARIKTQREDFSFTVSTVASRG